MKRYIKGSQDASFSLEELNEKYKGQRITVLSPSYRGFYWKGKLEKLMLRSDGRTFILYGIPRGGRKVEGYKIYDSIAVYDGWVDFYFAPGDLSDAKWLQEIDWKKQYNLYPLFIHQGFKGEIYKHYAILYEYGKYVVYESMADYPEFDTMEEACAYIDTL